MMKRWLTAIDKVFSALADPLLLAGRLVVVPMYLLAGIGKIGNYSATAGMMESHGLSGELLPLVILLEVVGSVFLAVGFLTRLTSLALAVFSLAAIFTFGAAPAVDNYLFLAEIAVVGAFLAFMAVGAGGWSIDALIGRARSPDSTRS